MKLVIYVYIFLCSWDLPRNHQKTQLMTIIWECGYGGTPTLFYLRRLPVCWLSLLLFFQVYQGIGKGKWEEGELKKQQGLVLPRSAIKKIKCFLDCCDSLVNFQGTTIFHSDNFCQSFHCFCGRRNFQSSICHHSRRASLICDLRSSLLNFIVSATSQSMYRQIHLEFF